MSNYLPGVSNVKDLNKKLKEYREVERQIEDAILEKRRELARIEAAKHKLKAKATYEPTQEALDYWTANCLRVAQQPRPLHGGPAGLRKAAAEAAAYDAGKRAA
jgi:biopolymer transport protein ExbB/TolQ